jgi:type IV pilus assembly protein PilQ
MIYKIKDWISIGALLMFFIPSIAFAAFDIEDRFINLDYSKKISMDFKGVPLLNVLKIFSKESGMNFISAANVADTPVTLYLKDISIEEALNKILEANNLTYELDSKSDVFIVKPKPSVTTITKVYTLKYASVASSKFNKSAKEASGSGGGGAKGGAAAASGGGGGGEGDVKGIDNVIKQVLSKVGKVQEDPRTNSYIITDVPEQFPLIEEMIAKLDLPVPQILIEVEMLDVAKSASDKIGIEYGNGTPFVTVTGATRSGTFPFDEALIRRKVDPTDDVVTWTIPLNGYDFSGMTAALDFLKSQSDTRSLARPKIMTLNNQPAHIEIGGNQTTSVETTTSAVGSSGSQTTTTAKKEKTSVVLDVTPQANVETGEILLQISPEVDEAKITQFRVNGAPVFDVEKRISTSTLKVKNGQTIMIGGLLRYQSSNTVSKIPFLGDMPLIGAAFRHKGQDITERELIIFITPKIVDENFKQDVEKSTDMFLDREVNRPTFRKY